ncbi:probable S-adenosylmethionine-dependent methyltransferase At5g38100, partial [Solanum tuberosum]|uniref:probable S-adenosylmethionine-dependent methyltransferase At5g38100 n=1 Tax=Solanum tuberosum TaxID=4113 RepID=UPI00073A3DDC
MARFFPMKGGEGVSSYTKNSLLQRNAADNAKGMIREAIIENFDIQTKTFLIVDLGCSVGPNTFFAMQNIVEAIKDKYHSQSEIEFQVFFNDHITNDFNILFKSLFSDQKPYFAAAIPGSFYGRLFPSCSLHIAYSCYALQWLSQMPKDMKNKRRIHYDGASIEVWNAYVAQFHKDMEVFLSARAEEIVPGGLIVLVLPAIPSEIQYSKIGYRIFTFLESSLIDMVNEGIVEEYLVDSFNFPVYFPSTEDMTKVVEKNGCFSIERMELTNPQSGIDANSFINHIRAGFEEMFTIHFGRKIADEMFERTLEKIEEISA